MTAVICTAAVGLHLELLELGRPRLEAYAERWFDDLRIATSILSDRPPSWHKISLLRDALQQFDTAVWVDADTLIVDPSRNILASPAQFGRYFYVARHHTTHVDPPCTNWRLPNAGVIIAHASPETDAFLDAIWDLEGYIGHPWWEQAAILQLLGYYGAHGLAEPTEPTPWSHLVGWLPLEFNSMPIHEPVPDPVIVHYSGMTHTARLEAMRKELDR